MNETSRPDDAVAETVKSASPNVWFGIAPNEIVWSLLTKKSLSETSKKTLSEACTWIRAWVVAVFGSVTSALPSFGVPASSVLHELPPSPE